MKENLTAVIALQDVEIEIFKAQTGLETLPREAAEIDSILQARMRSLSEIDEEITELNKKREPLETELKENQTILDAADSRIKKIKTNKEFLALQREIDIAKKRKADLEEHLLNLMEKIEKKTTDKEKSQKTFESNKAVLDEKMKKLNKQKNELEKRLKEFKSKIDGLRNNVAPNILSRYDRIKQNKKGLVVVECENGVCKGCNIQIQPQLFNELVKGDRLISCPLCQRILYNKGE